MQTPDRAASPFFVMNTSLDSDYDPLEIGDEVPGLNDGSDSDSEDDDLFDWNNSVVFFFFFFTRFGRAETYRRTTRWSCMPELVEDADSDDDDGDTNIPTALNYSLA